jgi:structural maintenance of chromosome 3 (chondroitin sulfate proteoglycan 6)
MLDPQVESARHRASEKSNKVHLEARTAHEKQKDVEKSLKELEQVLALLVKKKKQLEQTKKDDIKRRAQVELDVKDIEERLLVEHQGQEDRMNELRHIEQEVVRTQEELIAIRPFFEEKLKQEESTTSRIRDCEHRLAALYKKQGRSSQYKSQKEKDVAVSKELKERTNILHKKTEQVKKLKGEIQELTGAIMDRSTEISDREQRVQELIAAAEESNQKFAEVKEKRDELQNQRNANWKV